MTFQGVLFKHITLCRKIVKQSCIQVYEELFQGRLFQDAVDGKAVYKKVNKKGASSVPQTFSKLEVNNLE